jgi:hypothetical protein
VDECIDIKRAHGDPLPSPTAGRGGMKRSLSEVGGLAPEPRPSA